MRNRLEIANGLTQMTKAMAVRSALNIRILKRDKATLDGIRIALSWVLDDPEGDSVQELIESDTQMMWEAERYMDNVEGRKR